MPPSQTTPPEGGQRASVAGLDIQRVEEFFARNVAGGERPLQFALIASGSSNLTYRVWSDEHAWVLRRPPLGHVLPTAHDMAREYRVLAALAGSDVPVPLVRVLCTDLSVIGCPFYVMDYCDGSIFVDDTPDEELPAPKQRGRFCTSFIDTLVALHAVDYEAVGLGDFGRPDGYLERQLRRWSEQWERSKTGDLPIVDELARRLRLALPKSGRPSIVHGDYRIGNMMFARDDPTRVVAVLDWEMATLGDPLADLGYTLLYWGEPGDLAASLVPAVRRGSVTTRGGFLSRDELVQEYAKRTRAAVDEVDFYEILAAYKLAIISEGIYARHQQGLTVGARFEGMQRGSVPLFEFAFARADRSRNPALRGEA